MQALSHAIYLNPRPHQVFGPRFPDPEAGAIVFLTFLRALRGLVMTLRPYKHVLPAYQPIVLFSKNYLPMARINLKRATVLLVTGRAEPLALLGQTWQMRSPSLTLEIPEHIRLRVGNGERVWKTPPVNRREVLRRDGHGCQYCGSRRRPKAPMHPVDAFAENFWKEQTST